MPVTAEAISFDFGTAGGSLVLQDLAVPDFIGETSGAPDLSVPATLSLAMAWGDAGPELTVSDLETQHTGSYRECRATIAWSAAEQGFSFVAGDAGSLTSRFAQLGFERTGVFAVPQA